MNNHLKIKCEDFLKKNKLWENGYKIKENIHKSGQSRSFFVIDNKNKKKLIIKFFNYTEGIDKDILNVDSINSIDDFISMIDNSNSNIEIEDIIDLIEINRRLFNRYVEVCVNYECGYPKIYEYEECVKIGNDFWGIIVEEVIDGITLEMYFKMREKNKDLYREVVDFISKISKALKELNSFKIVHRDLSPDNIIKNDDKYTIIDPGVIKMLDKNQTKTFGYIFGKCLYASPEQYKGYASKADFSSDLYSLGIISFEYILGYNPLKKYIDISKGELPHKLLLNNLDREIEDDFFDNIEENKMTRRLYYFLCKLVQVEKRYRFKDMNEYLDFLSMIEGGM